MIKKINLLTNEIFEENRSFYLMEATRLLKEKGYLMKAIENKIEIEEKQKHLASTNRDYLKNIPLESTNRDYLHIHL